MYTKNQLEQIERMWNDLYPIKDIAKEMQKSTIAITEKIRHMSLPERDHHLVRILNFYGRELLKYGNTRQQIQHGMKLEYDKKRIERSIIRADRKQVAIDYLMYEIDHGHNKIAAIKRAYSRHASAFLIGRAMKMTTKEVTAIVKRK
jgi:predicted DNA-binding protein YlxM (UPF0122 family)